MVDVDNNEKLRYIAAPHASYSRLILNYFGLALAGLPLCMVSFIHLFIIRSLIHILCKSVIHHILPSVVPRDAFAT